MIMCFMFITPGGEISAPADPPSHVIKEEWTKMVESGKLSWAYHVHRSNLCLAMVNWSEEKSASQGANYRDNYRDNYRIVIMAH